MTCRCDDPGCALPAPPPTRTERVTMHKAALIALGIDPKQVPAGSSFTITPFGAPGLVRVEWTARITVSVTELAAALEDNTTRHDVVLSCPDCPATLAGHVGEHIEHVADGSHVHHSETRH